MILTHIWFVACVCGFVYCLLHYSERALAQPTLLQSVLIINQSTSISQWPTAIINGIISSMTTDSSQKLSYYIENMDLYQFYDHRYEEIFRNYLIEKYRTRQINIIIPIRPGAFNFIINQRTSLWPTVPVAFTALPPGTSTTNLPPGITGFIVDLNLTDMINVARMIVPNVRQFAIVGDRFKDQLYYRHFKDEFGPFSQTFGLIDLTGLTSVQSNNTSPACRMIASSFTLAYMRIAGHRLRPQPRHFRLLPPSPIDQSL